VVLVVALPPLGATFGFVNVPAGMLAMIAIIVVVYWPPRTMPNVSRTAALRTLNFTHNHNDASERPPFMMPTALICIKDVPPRLPRR
jgi:hypothetical protein